MSAATYAILFVFVLTAPGLKCQNGTTNIDIVVENGTITELTEGNGTNIEVTKENGTTVDLTSTENGTTETGTEPELEQTWNTRGIYGGSYYNPNAYNPKNIHYIHGTYQRSTRDYYKSQGYFRDEASDETIDYYLGFGLSKMTDADFEYPDFHHQYHDLNRTISNNDTIRSDFVVECHPNATYLCPENTETVCLMNGTIYCMSKISVVVPCPQDQEFICVNSTVPCVRACLELSYDFEDVSLPCLATIFIEDVYEDNKGMTIIKVGGTFVLVPTLSEDEKTFCVTVVVDPKRKSRD